MASSGASSSIPSGSLVYITVMMNLGADRLPIPLWLALVAALVVVQAVCWLLARGLRQRLGWIALGIGLVLPLALLAPWLDGSRLLAPTDPVAETLSGAVMDGIDRRHDLMNDALLQFLPWEIEVRRAVSAGRMPFWSDRLEGGSSPWANPQALVFSPVAWLARLFPLDVFFLVMLAAKVSIAFSGTWLLARRVGVSRFAAHLAGAGFALGGGIIAWGLFPNTSVVCWAPWLGMGTIELFRRPAPRALATTGAITGILLFSGQPEVAAGSGLLALFLGLGLARRGTFTLGRFRFPGLSASGRRGLAAAMVAAGLGFALAAPHLLPFAERLPDSARAVEKQIGRLPPLFPRPGRPASWFLPGRAAYMTAPLHPRAFGAPFQERYHGPSNWLESGAGYAGLIALSGAFAALAAGCRRARPFLFFALFATLAVAAWLPLAVLFDAIGPLRMPAWERMLLPGSLALAVAGALGWDRVLARATWRRAAVGVLIAAGLSLAIRHDPASFAIWLGVGACGACVAAVGVRRRFAAFRVLFWGALSLLLLADLGPWARAFLPSGQPRLFLPRSAVITALDHEVGQNAWRVVGEDFSLYPSLLAAYGFAELRPHNPLAQEKILANLDAAFGFRPSHAVYFARFRNVDHPLLDFLNVRLVVSNTGQPRPRTLRRIWSSGLGSFRLWRNPDALPRWFLAEGADLVTDRDLAAWISGMRDPRRVALRPEEVEKLGNWRLAFGSSAGRAAPPVGSLGSRPGDLRLRLPPDPVPAAGDRLLATSLPGPAGWRAFGSGSRLRILTVNGAYLGVRIPAGVEEIRLIYRPPGLEVGITLAALSLVALGGLFVLAHRRPGLRYDRREILPP